MSIDITPPQAIVDFAQKAGYKWGVEFVREWNGFQVFFPNLQPNITYECSGLPQYILFKNDNVRWADDKERNALMYLDNKKR